MLTRELIFEVDHHVDKLTSKLKYRDGYFVTTNSIIDAVSSYTNIHVKLHRENFSTLIPTAPKLGAVMCVTKSDKNGELTADIVLNTEKSSKFQRFSLVHELGHLATSTYAIQSENNVFTLCNQISYEFPPILDFNVKPSKQNSFEKVEMIANIFALKMLLPIQKFAAAMMHWGNVSIVADRFGVTTGAVCSRSLLGL